MNLYTTNNIYTSTNIATKAFRIHYDNFLSKTSHMVTNNAPLPNAFTNEEPKHNFCCYKRVQPCFLKHNKHYRNGTYFQLSITSWDRKTFPRLNRNIKDKYLWIFGIMINPVKTQQFTLWLPTTCFSLTGHQVDHKNKIYIHTLYIEVWSQNIRICTHNLGRTALGTEFI